MYLSGVWQIFPKYKKRAVSLDLTRGQALVPSIEKWYAVVYLVLTFFQWRQYESEKGKDTLSYSSPSTYQMISGTEGVISALRAKVWKARGVSGSIISRLPLGVHPKITAYLCNIF